MTLKMVNGKKKEEEPVEDVDMDDSEEDDEEESEDESGDSDKELQIAFEKGKRLGKYISESADW